MKYIISVFIAFFAFLFIGFKVECLNTVTGYDDDNKPSWVYYDASSLLNENFGSYDTNTFPYYIEFSLLRNDIPSGQRNYINIYRLAFRDKITFNFATGTYQFYVPNSSFYLCGLQYYNSSTWERSYNPNSNTQHFSFPYGAYSSAYVSAGNIPFTFNGNTVEPPPDLQGDTFFVTKDGFTNNFGVFCGPASEYVDNGEQLPLNYYRTKVYTVHIKFQYQGSTIDFIVPNYLNWLYKYNTYVKTQDVSDVLEYLPAYTFYAQPVYNTSMQAIRCPVINEPTLFANVVGYDFDNMTDYRSFNQITLSQLLSALTPTYSNLTINDLYTVLTFEFYDSDGNKVYSAANDYSSLYNSGVEPTPDPYVTNLINSTETLNQNITSNNKYLQDIIYGDVYEPFPYEQSIIDAGSVNLDLISVPDYTYEKHNIDSTASSFFGRMVEWWYLDSPFGIVAIVALTFLVIRVILW